MSNMIELFGQSTVDKTQDWKSIVARQWCPYLERNCIKVRKSQPEISIGSCSVLYGKGKRPIIICPYRLLERRQVFTDCLHLLTVHEPGNELHIVPEVSIPGGSVDYFLTSVRDGKVKDFVGVELQTLDTTGTVWPARQKYLQDVGVNVIREEAASYKTYGMNWKMTAKTILIQLHHKVQTFEAINKHLVLAIQDFLLEYLRKEFQFSHLTDARGGDPHASSCLRYVAAEGFFVSSQPDVTPQYRFRGNRRLFRTPSRDEGGTWKDYRTDRIENLQGYTFSAWMIDMERRQHPTNRSRRTWRYCSYADYRLG